MVCTEGAGAVVVPVSGFTFHEGAGDRGEVGLPSCLCSLFV